MTIAACYLSPEGVVLGADSTSTILLSSGPGAVSYHYLNHNQKLFELGEASTVGVVTWGLGGLSGFSYRTLLALLADDVKKNAPKDVKEIADRWASFFWGAYSKDLSVQLYQALAGKPPHDPADPTNTANRTKEEEEQLQKLKRDLVVGFCVAGYWNHDRTPMGFQIIFEPSLAAAPSPTGVRNLSYAFWGAPNMIRRLIFGVDENIRGAILKSGKWNGTDAELDTYIDQFQLAHPVLPIRDAIDFVHACIHSTIKAIKFSNLEQICGGPIEIAVITSDRRFRWVRHKAWDAAITEGAI